MICKDHFVDKLILKLQKNGPQILLSLQILAELAECIKMEPLMEIYFSNLALQLTSLVIHGLEQACTA